jgi:hypothetical protein
MSTDLETALVRELHQVADGVEVPAMPALPSEPHTRSVWAPLLVAAAVVLIIVGAVATVTTLGGDDGPQPAPSPSPSVVTEDPTEDSAEQGPVSTAPPNTPYVVNDQLFVGGQQVPGNDWANVRGTDTGWVAARFDGGEMTNWWGYDAEPQRIEGFVHQGLAVSPDGHYWAAIVDDGQSQGLLTGADTESGGEGFGGTRVDRIRGGVYTSAAAVTEDGLVITGSGPAVLWKPLVDGTTVDLGETAPGQTVLGNTGAGLIVVDTNSVDNIDGARYGDVYLADISEDGEITRIATLPNHDLLFASDAWLAWVDAGSLGGELDAIGQLQVQRIDGGDHGRLTPPDGWMFRIGGWTWEDDEHLIGVAVQDGGDNERMVRCRPSTLECVLLDTP